MDVKGRKIAVSPAVWLVGLAALFLIVLSIKREIQTSETSFQDVVKQGVARELTETLYQSFVPVFSFVQQGEEKKHWLLDRQINEMIPLYGYYGQQNDRAQSEERTKDNYLSLEEILLAEAQEGSGGFDAEGTGQNENMSDMQDLLKAENEAALQMEHNVEQQGQADEVASQTLPFTPHTLQNEINLQEISSYESLVKNFYTIDKNTMAGSDQLNVSGLMEKDMTISKEGEGPQILIYHTHSQEAFRDSIPGDMGTGIVGVGEHLSEILTSQYGYRVLHHTGQYDLESRDDAYSKALPGIEQVLAENPSVQVVIDLHRDAIAEETRLVTDLDGRPTARFMFFNGLSRTKKTGNIAYLYNENQADNLAFSFQMQLKATEYYPGLVRKIYLKGYRYNMHLRPRTLLIELGAQNNTVEEAMNACDPLAHILNMVLTGEE